VAAEAALSRPAASASTIVWAGAWLGIPGAPASPAGPIPAAPSARGAPEEPEFPTSGLRALFADPVEILNAIVNGERDAPMQKRLRDAAAAFSARWEHLPTETQHHLVRSILVRAQVHADRIDLDVGSERLVSWLLNEGVDEGIVEGNRRSSANAAGCEETLIGLTIRASLKRTGNEMKFIVEGVTNAAPSDTTLIRLLVRGQKIAKRLFEPNCPPLEAVAREEEITASYATRIVRLAFLAPDIVAAILAGKQPAGLTANKLMADTRLPLDWRDQRVALGFA
jgi:site-specific DNA recombinase